MAILRWVAGVVVPVPPVWLRLWLWLSAAMLNELPPILGGCVLVVVHLLYFQIPLLAIVAFRALSSILQRKRGLKAVLHARATAGWNYVNVDKTTMSNTCETNEGREMLRLCTKKNKNVCNCFQCVPPSWNERCQLTVQRNQFQRQPPVGARICSGSISPDARRRAGPSRPRAAPG